MDEALCCSRSTLIFFKVNTMKSKPLPKKNREDTNRSEPGPVGEPPGKNLEGLYKSIFESMLYEAHVWRLVRDDHGVIKTWCLIDANPAALDNWKQSLQEIRGKTADEIFPGADATITFMPIIQKIFREKKPHSWESFFSGTHQTLKMVSIPLGEIFVSMGADISDIKQVHNELKQSQERLILATEAAKVSTWEYLLASNELVWDESNYRLYGADLSTTERPYSIWSSVVHKEDFEDARRDLDKAIGSLSPMKSEFRIVRHENSEIRYIQSNAIVITNDDGEAIKLIGTNIDVSDWKNSERELSKSKDRLEIATKSADIGVWEYDLDNQSLAWDTSMYKIYGVSELSSELPYTTWSKSVHTDDFDEATRTLEESIAKQSKFNTEFRIVCQKSGDTKYIIANASFQRGVDGEPDKMVGVNIDITERRRSEQKVEKLAFFDTLTGLPNRSMINDRLSQSIALNERTNNYSALVFVDLDNFKKINDSVGHAIGDELLIEFSTRVLPIIRKGDTFGRFGGDEFIIILNNLSQDASEAARTVSKFSLKFIELISGPFNLSTGFQQATASLGICLYNGACSASDTLRQADLAMYKAKELGRNQACFFDLEMQDRILQRIELEQDLLAAIENDDLYVYYQAQINDDGKIRGAEALLRWWHPIKGYISPAVFVPIAEDAGHIKKLGQWVFKKACRDFKETISLHVDRDFTLSINVSALQILDDKFVEMMTAEVLATHVEASRLKIELTETALVNDSDLTMAKMLELKNIGFCFSLDDFGTGFSSLTRLKQLPIDELKIDKSFVHDILDDEHSKAIAQSVIALAGALNLGIIAEGVELEGQKALLKDMGCSTYQGFLFSKPIPLKDFIAFIQSSGGSPPTTAPVCA